MFGLMKTAILFLAVYPLALGTQLLIESKLGDGLFLDQFTYESKRRLLKLIIFDWMDAAVWIVPIMIVGILIVRYTPKGMGAMLVALAALIVGAATYMWMAIPGLLGFTVAYALVLSLFFLRRRSL
jgi:hypothetical protein